jgi:hypothetical protein
MRRAARQDKLHGAVIRLFQEQGYDVLDLSKLGDGVPDLLVARGAFAFLLEVKSENSVRHGRKDDPFTEPQKAFWDRWKSAIYTVTSLEQAWELVDLFSPKEAEKTLA